MVRADGGGATTVRPSRAAPRSTAGTSEKLARMPRVRNASIMRQSSGRLDRSLRSFLAAGVPLWLLACSGAEVAPGAAQDAVGVRASDAPLDENGQPTVRAVAMLPSDPTASLAPREPSVSAVAGYEKIFQKPDTKSPLIGLFRAGQSVPLADPNPQKGPGVGHCKGGFYAVKPRGFVCVGQASTLDPDDPRVLAAAEVLPDPTKPMPFKVGAMVRAAPQYKRIPTPAEQRKAESDLDKHLADLPALAKQEGVDVAKAGQGPSPRILQYIEAQKPPLVAEKDAFKGRKMAFVGEFDAEGRTFYVTPDLTFVPKDKVKLATPSNLVGVDLRKGEMKFPIGYTWIEDTAKLKKTHDGKYVETGELWPRQTFLQLKGQLVRGKGGNYWETSDGHYVRNDLVTIFKKREGRPAGVGSKEKWIDVRITWGTLVAYEGDTPVYVTAISPGQDGITERAHGHTTKRGTYSVGWKLITADMAGVEKKEPWAVDDVPFVAYYKDSYAVHGAWWHNEFGRPKSHGCVNVAPNDARLLWEWMEPGLPQGWYAAAAYYPEIKGTTVLVRP